MNAHQTYPRHDNVQMFCYKEHIYMRRKKERKKKVYVFIAGYVNSECACVQKGNCSHSNVNETQKSNRRKCQPTKVLKELLYMKMYCICVAVDLHKENRRNNKNNIFPALSPINIVECCRTMDWFTQSMSLFFVDTTATQHQLQLNCFI